MLATRNYFLWSVVILVAAARPGRADELSGEQLYKKHCAWCHGAAGDGSKRYKMPLVGDKSVAELAKQIAGTMPEDDPTKITPDEAKRVAAYAFEAFYSPAAQARNKPPRVELARLTVGQYRNAVADVVGTFRQPTKWDDKQPGLKGEYYAARGFQQNKRLIDRLDPEVRFDFGTEGPGEKFEANEFTIRWSGSVLAPETGDYEFVVKTDHAARLWVNDLNRPLIDAWVKSGNDTEYRAPLYLLAGRAVPLRLEFTKAKQGVNDPKFNKPGKFPAIVELQWRRPHRIAEVIASRFLTPGRAPEAWVVSTPFPPDDRSYGWERGTTVSKAWDAATTDAALDTAGYVAARLGELAGVNETAPDRVPKLKDFCRRFAERAFRRPLTDDEKRLFIDRQFETAGTPDVAVKRAVLLVLKSPRFLYHDATGGNEVFAVASRLSFALWDSLPDAELLAAAAAGKLAASDQVRTQAERMLGDPRAKAKLREFLLAWVKADQPADLAKDAKRFPGFDPAIAADLRTSLELFLDDVVWGEGSDFRRLLLSEDVFLNGRLAKFYGVGSFPDPVFIRVPLDRGTRAGVLTHPYLMASFAYTGSSSPIHRGVFVARGVLGITLRPPQDAFTPLAEDLHPTLTTRERVALQTSPAACQGCHTTINALGFTLEHFDAVGRYREQDNSKPVDSSGSYTTHTGETVKFATARELATFLADSPEVHAAFAEKLFHHLVKQPVRAYGARRPEELRAAFAAGKFDIRKLAVEIAVVAALRNP